MTPVKIVSIGKTFSFGPRSRRRPPDRPVREPRLGRGRNGGVAADGEVALVLADLGFRGVDSIAWATRWKQAATRPRLVAYGSHVDVELHERARAAGFDLVLPKSQFHRQLIDIIGAADLAAPAGPSGAGRTTRD